MSRLSQKTRAPYTRAMILSSELDVQPDGRHDHRTAVAVISWIGDVLNVEGRKNTASEAGCVIGLDYFFKAIAQSSVTEQKTFPAEL